MISALDTSQYIPDYDDYSTKKLQQKGCRITHASKLNKTGIIETLKSGSSEQSACLLPFIC